MTGRRAYRSGLTTRAVRQVAVVGSVVAAAALVLGVILAVQGRRARSDLEDEIIGLRAQISRDRHTRVARLAGVAKERQKAAEREASTAAELEALRELHRSLRQEIAVARSRAASGDAEVTGLRARLEETRHRLRAFETDQSRAEQMIGRFQGGVAFVEGTYGFFDASGAPLRRFSADAEGGTKAETGGKPLYSAAGTGPLVRFGYTGTAFLVSPDGLLLTNRHIAEPWRHAERSHELVEQGFSPRLTALRAYFPGVPSPFDLRVVAVSDQADAATVVADLGGRALPVLPLETGKTPPAAGQPVVLLGYPTGLDALLARLDEAVLQSVLESSGGESERITAELARRGLIRPLATQGHLADALPGQLIYDAQTTLGGSGGPVVNARGRVIGLNAAILTDFSGASFGVPVRFAAALLPKVPKAVPGVSARARRPD